MPLSGDAPGHWHAQAGYPVQHRAAGSGFALLSTPPGEGLSSAAPNHSPRFQVDEAGLLPAMRAMLHLVVDYTGSA